jgi:hypothetical protein
MAVAVLTLRAKPEVVVPSGLVVPVAPGGPGEPVVPLQAARDTHSSAAANIAAPHDAGSDVLVPERRRLDSRDRFARDISNSPQKISMTGRSAPSAPTRCARTKSPSMLASKVNAPCSYGLYVTAQSDDPANE